jgi:cytochrome c peroxidase
LKQVKLISVIVLLLGGSFYFISKEKPSINSSTAVCIQLGHHLFFDKNLSHNHTKSCASCHAPEFAFTDGYRTSISPLGENLKHNAPSILNASELHYFDWNNSSATTLEEQIHRPLFGTTPIELGLDKHWDEFVQYFMNNKFYKKKHQEAFGKNATLTQQQLITCMKKNYKAPIAHTINF